MTACTATDHDNERSHTLGARLDGRDYEDEVLLNAIARDPTPLADGRGVAQGRDQGRKEERVEHGGRRESTGIYLLQPKQLAYDFITLRKHRGTWLLFPESSALPAVLTL